MAVHLFSCRIKLASGHGVLLLARANYRASLKNIKTKYDRALKKIRTKAAAEAAEHP